MKEKNNTHLQIQNIILDALKKEGYDGRLEFRIGNRVHDVMIWDKDDNLIAIEVIWYHHPFTKPKDKVSNIKCHHCEYEWFTRSIKGFISCPRCMTKVKRR